MPIASQKLGLWLIGAAGNVATTVAVGLAAAVARRATPIGLLTETSACKHLPVCPLAQIVIGGHEVAKRAPIQTANELATMSGVFDPGLLRSVSPALKRYTRNIRTGYSPGRSATASLRSVLRKLVGDIKRFRAANRLGRVVVVNVASAEPAFRSEATLRNWEALSAKMSNPASRMLPASAVYALAAIEAGAAYVNFTPSIGADLSAIRQRAQEMGVPIMGSDAKTGESLLRSALAPVFEDRCLEVLSWTGANILGNRDGENLSDEAVKAAKLRSKDAILASLLSRRPATRTTIEYVESLHDWKTAWNHVHFAGFLGAKMTLQFTWQGCDSILAAPLVIDLARLTDLHMRRGLAGVMTHLACFFKSPMDVRDQHFHRQMIALRAYLDTARAEVRR